MTTSAPIQPKTPSGPVPGWKMLHAEYIALGGTKEELDAALALVQARGAGKISATTKAADALDSAKPGPIADAAARTEAEGLEAYYTAMHSRAKSAETGDRLRRRRVALCFSGGGIRSATFNLGILQGLAENNLLDRVDYLSTVSGGGYVGSWFSSWRSRSRSGLGEVARQLRSSTDGDATGAEPVTSPGRPPRDDAPARALPGEWRPTGARHETPPIQHLRRYSRYLSPRVGLTSMDTWTIASTYLRNLVLNWLVIIPLIAAILMLPRIAVVMADGIWNRDTVSPIYAGLAGLLAGVLAFIYPSRWSPGATADRPQQTRSFIVPGFPPIVYTPGRTAHFLLFCWVPLTLASLLLPVYMMRPERPILSTGNWYGFLNWFAGMDLLKFGLLLGIVSFVTLAIRRPTWEIWRHFFGVVVGGAALGVALELCRFVLGKLATSEIGRPVFGDGRAIQTVIFGPPLVLLALSFGGTLYVGLVSRLGKSRDTDREWWARLGAWLLAPVFFWVVITSLVLIVPSLFLMSIDPGSQWFVKVAAWSASAAGVISGIASVLGGLSARSAATNELARSGGPSPASRLLSTVAAPLFLLSFVAAISLSTSGTLLLLKNNFPNPSEKFDFWSSVAAQSTTPMKYHLRMILETNAVALWSIFAVLTVFGLVLASLIQLNRFSMHSLYRTRLIRAYLGASRFSRTPNPFTAFDDRDNLYMYELRPEMLRSSDIRDERGFFNTIRAGITCPDRDMLLTTLASHVSHEDPFLMDDLRRLIDSNPDWLNDQRAKNEVSVLLSRLCRAINTVLIYHPWDAKAGIGAESEDALNRDAVIANRRIFDQYFKEFLRVSAEPEADNHRRRLAREIRPFHVVNMALNLVGDSDIAIQDRKASSFSASPLCCGSFELGYRDSCDYGGPRGMSLGTAMTISGAAVSPNMGYHSSPLISLILALFNVRLGSWLGNPGKPGDPDFYKLPSPTFSIWPLAFEAFGLTNAARRHVYLSDGGHFENLGLYEMVRRRCHVIIVSDASADVNGTFEDLGRAFERIGIDLGVRVSLVSRGGEQRIKPRSWQAGMKADRDGRYCAIGRIHYSERDPGAVDGILIYIKAAVYGLEPISVTTYAAAHETFPHESTGDQFFTESQFESYRLLGCHTIASIMKSDSDARRESPLDHFIAQACAHRNVGFNTDNFTFDLGGRGGALSQVELKPDATIPAAI